MFQHFPGREKTKDSLVAADLAADCLEAAVSESALSFVCREFRLNADEDNPFLPPTGAIIKRCKERTEFERRASEPHRRPDRPEPAARAAERAAAVKVPWLGKDWSDFSASDKVALDRHLADLSAERRRDYRLYLRDVARMPVNDAEAGT